MCAVRTQVSGSKAVDDRSPESIWSCLHLIEERVLEVRGVDREGGGQRLQFFGSIDAEESGNLFGVPLKQGGALDEGTGAGAALRHADDLAPGDGDLALSDPREAHLAAPGGADHRAVVPRGLDTEGTKRVH